MEQVPDVTFKTRVDGEWVDLTTSEIFDNKRVVLFALPGAFTPTCSTYQLPGYEEMYDDICAQGIDDIYCLSVNDSFVMNAWFKDQGIEKVKALPDGFAFFTGQMNMLVLKNNLGFGMRSWRYAMVVNNGVIEQLWEEPGKEDDAEGDPYEVSDPRTVLTYLTTGEQQ